MILPPNVITKILAGRKTQHRIPVIEPREITRKNKTTYTSSPFRPQTGKVYALTTRTDDDQPPNHMLVTNVTTQQLGQITYPDVLAEGLKTTDQFKHAWVRDHDRNWWDRHIDEQDLLPEAAMRFDEKHADTTVWVLTIEPFHDTDEWLARPTRNSGDYTTTYTRAIDDTPTVGKAWRDKFARDAQAANEERQKQHRQQREKLPLHERLRRLETDPPPGVDQTKDLRLVRAKIAELERKRGDKAA